MLKVSETVSGKINKIRGFKQSIVFIQLKYIRPQHDCFQRKLNVIFYDIMKNLCIDLFLDRVFQRSIAHDGNNKMANKNSFRVAHYAVFWHSINKSIEN